MLGNACFRHKCSRARQNLGSHWMKSSTSTTNGAVCINRSAESGTMSLSVPVAIPDERNPADDVAAEANSSGTVLGAVSGRRGRRGGATSRSRCRRRIQSVMGTRVCIWSTILARRNIINRAL